MSEHKVTLTWNRGEKPFEYQKYSRDHTWKFEGGHEMQASAAPAYLGNPNMVDPEEAFVASLSSFHMLTFFACGRCGSARKAKRAGKKLTCSSCYPVPALLF